MDAATAPQLYAELALHTQGGTQPLTVDLSGVTHLASAGVAVLHAATASAEADAGLRLFAPRASTASHVLELVALPHTTEDPATTTD